MDLKEYLFDRAAAIEAIIEVFETAKMNDVDDDGDEDESDEWRLRQIMGNKEYEHMVDSMAVFDDEFEDG